MKEIVLHDRIGLLVERQPQDVATACLRLLGDDEEARRLDVLVAFLHPSTQSNREPERMLGMWEAFSPVISRRSSSVECLSQGRDLVS